MSLTQCADAPIARASASVFVLNDTAYILGGRTEADWSYPNDFYRYTPATDTWEKLDNLPFEGRSKMVTVVCNGKAYCGGGFGGDHKESYSYKTDWWTFDGNTWQQMQNIPTENTDGLIGFTISDKVYIGYGFKYDWAPELYVFDTKIGLWSELHKIHHLHYGLGHAFAQAGERVFAGLGYFTQNSNKWSEFISDANTWEQRAPLPCQGGISFAATATDQYIYLAGGRAFGGSLTEGMIYDHIWSYSVNDNNWALCAHLPQPTENMIAFTISGIPYFGLGEDADGKRLNKIYKLNCINTK